MKTPKILPWLARRAGVPLKRAEQLWTRAVKIADLTHGTQANTSDYWKCAVDNLTRLLKAEQARLGMNAALAAQGARVEALFRFGPSTETFARAMRYQAQFGLMSFDIAECVARNGRNYWRAMLGRLAA